jgi:putative endonuclease
MGDARDLGRWGEDAAAAYLEKDGMRVVARNWRCRVGEIDIVAMEDRTLVFCEVKTRSGLGFGTPLGAITPAKCARLRRLAAAYLAEVGGHPGPIRIDAVGILRGDGGDLPLVVDHVRGAA